MEYLKAMKASAFVVIAVLITVLVLPGIGMGQLTINAVHNHVKIQTFYHGGDIKLSGETDPGADIVIKIVSPEREDTLREKGKIGIFWLNTVKLKFEHVPDLYMLYSNRDIKDIRDMLSQEELDKNVIGYPALEKHIKIEPLKSETDKTRWFNEFIKFKEASGLYGISPKRISLTQKGGLELYNIDIDWPYQATPGKYKAIVYVVKGGKVFEKAETNILVEQDGLVKTIAKLASKNGALYGSISIVIALVVGFIIGLVFKK